MPEIAESKLTANHRTFTKLECDNFFLLFNFPLIFYFINLIIYISVLISCYLLHCHLGMSWDYRTRQKILRPKKCFRRTRQELTWHQMDRAQSTVLHMGSQEEGTDLRARETGRGNIKVGLKQCFFSFI